MSDNATPDSSQSGGPQNTRAMFALFAYAIRRTWSAPSTRGSRRWDLCSRYAIFISANILFEKPWERRPLEMLVRRAVVAAGERRPLARLALARRRLAAA